MVDIVLGLFELVLAVVLGVVTTWFAFHRFSKMTKNIEEMSELKKNNVAVGILLGSTILSVAFVVKETSDPVASSLQTVVHGGLSVVGLLKVVAVGLGAIALAMVMSLTSIWLALRIFLRLTREIDELAEIRANNVAVAVVLGCVIVVIGLFLGHGIQSLLAAIIPMPSFGQVQVM
jgi:uncharacterized membrane protein YjfL (UPF0719 family)